MKQIALAAVAGALVSFAWGFVSWMVLSWHVNETKSFADEAAVAAVIRANAAEPGFYALPAMPKLPKNARMDEVAAAEQKHKDDLNRGPAVYATVRPQSKLVDMNDSLIRGLGRSFAAALVLALLLSMTSSLDYIQRVGFCTLVGLFVGLNADLPQMIWFEAPLRYTLVNALDHVAECLLVGLIVGGIVKGRDNL